MKSLLLLLLAVPAWSQTADQAFPLPLFKDGLYTRYSANAIPDGALPEALNVTLDTDVDGVVVARNGYSKYNTSAITDSKTVRGEWTFDATDGTKYFVAFSSQSFYKSTGDGIWAQITGLTGFSATSEFDCVQTIGKLWCGNGATVFSWDGTSTATVSGAPLGNILGRFRNRVLISGVSGSKGRTRGSGELDGTDWTVQIPGVSTTPFSLAFGGADDGEDITCLMGTYQDVFLVGKRNSLWGLYGFGRNDFQIREISREVGCLEHRSVKEKNNCLYWLSLRGIEKYCGARIERISDPIRDKLDTIVATAGNARSAPDTTQSDFEAGNLTASGPGAPISATISAGNIVVTTASFSDTSASDFAAGTLINVTTGTPGTLALSSFTFRDAWSNGTYTTGVTTWTVTQGAFSVANSFFRTGGDSVSFAHSTQVNISSGHWQFNYKYNENANVNNSCLQSAGDVCLSYRFTKKTNGDYYALEVAPSGGTGPHTVSIVKSVSGTRTFLTSYRSINLNSDQVVAFAIDRTTDGRIYISADGVYLASTTDTSVTGDSYTEFMLEEDHDVKVWTQFVSGLYAYQYPPAGSIVSRIFDTGVSTPVWGSLSSTFTAYNSALEGNIAFYLQTSTASDGGGFGSLVSSSDTLKPTVTPKRYVRYQADFSTFIATKTPTLEAISLDAATTGYFISQCRNPGSDITSWGLFSCTQELNSGGLTHYVSTGNTCSAVTRTTATWNTQVNNTEIAISTALYVAYRVLFSVDSPTQTPRIRDCTINWLEGAARPPVASSVYRDRYYLAYTSSTATGSVNDHILVLDKNDKWTLFSSHNCYSLVNYERNLYCGSSTSAGQVWRLDNGSDDDGTAITSKIRTKAFNLGLPERIKRYKNVYLDLEPSPDPTQTITLTGRYLLERSTKTYSLGTVDLNEDPGSIMTSKFPFPLTNPVSGRYIQLELESTGLNSPWRLFGGRLYFQSLDLE